MAISHFACWSLSQLQIWPAASWRSWLEIHGDSVFFVSEMIIGIRVYAKFKVDFTSKTILLRRRGLAMGSSYAVLLLFFSFEGAQSCYHVAAVWNQPNTPKMVKMWMQQLYHWNFKGFKKLAILWCERHSSSKSGPPIQLTDLARHGKLPYTRWMTSQS